MSDLCISCHFFEHKDEHGGWCHRFPPQLVHETFENMSRGQTMQYFPWIQSNEWCGEHKKAEPRRFINV
jgi:hypothetical protein